MNAATNGINTIWTIRHLRWIPPFTDVQKLNVSWTSPVLLRPNDLDKQVRCIRCQKTTPARKWLCQCNVPWVTCEVHQTYYCNKVIKQENQKETEKSHVNLRPCMLKRRRNNESGQNEARSKRAKTNMICNTETGNDGNEVELDYMPPPKIKRILGPKIQSRFPMASRSSGSRGRAGAVLDTASWCDQYVTLLER